MIKINMLLKKPITYVIAILFFMSITNPTLNDFKSFAEVKKPNDFTLDGAARVNYFIVFSIYEFSYSRFDWNGRRREIHAGSKKYVGFMKNFFEL